MSLTPGSAPKVAVLGGTHRFHLVNYWDKASCELLGQGKLLGQETQDSNAGGWSTSLHALTLHLAARIFGKTKQPVENVFPVDDRTPQLSPPLLDRILRDLPQPLEPLHRAAAP